MLQLFQNFKGLTDLKRLSTLDITQFKSYFKFFKKERENLLAIDIGSSSIKLVEIGKKDGKLKLEKFSILPLPAGCIEHRHIKSYSVLTEILSKFVQENGYVNRDTAIILSGPQVVTQVLKVPIELADNQLMTHIELEAEKYLPFNVDELAIDFDVIKSGEANQHENYIEVLLAAAKKDFVDEYINVIKAVDLKLKVIDVYGCVMARLSSFVTALQLQEDMKDKVIAMVDIGQDILTVSIFKNGRQIHLKEQNFGGKELNRLIMQEHSVSYEQAEELKLKAEDPMISVLINTFKEQLAMQVFQVLQFFYSSLFADKINYVFILGGVAKLKDLDRAMANKINLPVYLLDPFTDVNTNNYEGIYDLSTLDSRLSPVCGLAFRSYFE